MVIRFIARTRRPLLDLLNPVRDPLADPLLENVRLESHPSGLNRTDARRLSRREVEHRERMLEHLQRMSG